MATANGGSILGGYKGKVGTVTLSTWMSIETMRSNMGKKKKLPSEKQLTQIGIMKLVSSFLSPLLRIINLGYQQPKYPEMSKMNAAVSYHIKNALVGDDKNRFFDLSKIKLSKPIRSTQLAWNPLLEFNTERTIKISWELNPFPLKSTQLDDKVILVFYHKELDRFDMRSLIRRDDLTHTYTSSLSTVGHEVFCYMVLTSADGKLVSHTKYIGMGNVMA